MSKTKIITVENTEISVILQNGTDDFICLTDMARYKDNDPAFIIGHWLRLRNTIEYMGTWEVLHNPNFKPTEFGRLLSESGSNAKQERIRILFRMAKTQMETFDKNDMEQRFRNQFPQGDVGKLLE